MLDRVQLKREAKQITQNARVSAYGFTLLYLVIITVLDAASTYVNGDIVITAQEYFPDLVLPAFFYRAVEFPRMSVLFVTVMVSLLGTVLHGGVVLYHMGVRQGREMPYTTLFDGFALVGKLIVLDIVMYILVALWSMLFVIPGVIALYRYRFAVYNLCEDPSRGILEVLRMSKVQTRGYKGSLFLLDLSFLGWSFLCTLTLGVLSIWVAPWMVQADLGYYGEICRRKNMGCGYRAPFEDGENFQNDNRF